MLGLRLPDCVEILNPPRDYPVLPGTMLIYLADRPVLEPPP